MILPPLRQELSLHKAPKSTDGQPTWTIGDPSRNQYFRIDWQSFEIIKRWSMGANKLIADINQSTTLQITADDVQMVADFLLENQLLVSANIKTAADLVAQQNRSKQSKSRWLLHHYLFFRIPLINPDRWLNKTVSWVSFFYTALFFKLTLSILIVGLMLLYRNIDQFKATFIDLFSLQGLMAYGFALVVVKIIHEFAHAYTAKRYGCRVPSMGIAFLVMWPVAYTDTNEVWKISDRWQRLYVVMSGVTAELMIAAWATLAWSLLPEGNAKEIAFILATTTWVTTLLINSSPFLRFDGYFFLSDWLDMPNLHQRSFAFGRWHLREILFSIKASAPEYFSKKRTRGLIILAYLTWLYRLVLFLGIAVLVYHFFFKLLGIFLFVVEIIWFIALPVFNEIKQWVKLWPVIKQQRRSYRSVFVFIFFILLFLVPWPSALKVAGLLQAQQIYTIYAPQSAQLTDFPWQEGDEIKQGQRLLSLKQQGLELEQLKAHLQQVEKQWLMESGGIVNTQQQKNFQLQAQALLLAQLELKEVKLDLNKYQPKAPFDGVLRDVNPELQVGNWLKDKERIALLVQKDSCQVETYLDETVVHRIKVGDSGRFYANGLQQPFVKLTVKRIDLDATRELLHPSLATHLGGTIDVREKNNRLIPEKGIYHIVLACDENIGALNNHRWRGSVMIQGEWKAPVQHYWTALLVLFWRESGF